MKGDTMKYLKYPDEVTLNGYLAKREPMLIAISFDGETALISQLDDNFEHHILLAHFGIKQTDIDKYFRIAVDEDTADWTFVCPPDYKGITDRKRRITAFYNDGINAISKVLADIGYYSDIRIPKRYRRHFEALGDDSTYLPY